VVNCSPAGFSSRYRTKPSIVPLIIIRGFPIEHNMLVRVLRAMPSGDDVPDAAEIKLGVVAWVPVRDPLRKLLRPESTDDDSEERTDNGEENVLGTVLRLVVVAWVPSPEPVGTSRRLDDGSEKIDERVER
jgi:hypothetical protein